MKTDLNLTAIRKPKMFYSMYHYNRNLLEHRFYYKNREKYRPLFPFCLPFHFSPLLYLFNFIRYWFYDKLFPSAFFFTMLLYLLNLLSLLYLSFSYDIIFIPPYCYSSIICCSRPDAYFKDR